MSDPLAQYRKKPVGAVGETTPPKASNEYVAFDAKDRVERLKIRLANEAHRSPRYGDLLDISYDGPFGTNFVLTYSFMILVLVEGRNLQPVIAALQMSTAEFIQEFDGDKWQKPADEKAPFIESIKVVSQQGGPSLPQNGKSGNERAQGRSLH
ncbi:MAG: hypothetical protein WDM80_12760 [Limisphaerales bacterium]